MFCMDCIIINVLLSERLNGTNKICSGKQFLEQVGKSLFESQRLNFFNYKDTSMLQYGTTFLNDKTCFHF